MLRMGTKLDFQGPGGRAKRRLLLRVRSQSALLLLLVGAPAVGTDMVLDTETS